MGEADGGVAVVEAEAIVLIGTVDMRNVHMAAVVLVEEMMIEITVPMTGAGDLEAVVLDVGLEREVEAPLALGEGGIRVQSEKVVLKEGLR